MSRLTLLFWQLMVAVVALALWQFLATVPVFGKILLPPFFFSTRRCRQPDPQMVHLRRDLEAFDDYAVGGRCWLSSSARLAACWSASGSRRQPRVAAVFDPYVKMVNALPRVVLAPIFALWLGLGIWSKVALGVTLVSSSCLQRLSGRQGSQPDRAGQRPHARHERAAIDAHVYWPSALSWMFSSLHTSVGLRRGRCGRRRISGIGGRSRLFDPAGRRRVRRRRRIRRHVRAVGLRHPDRRGRDAGRAALAGLRPNAAEGRG